MTSLPSRDATWPIVKGALVTIVPLTELMQDFISKTDPIRDPRVAFNGLASSQISVCIHFYAQAYHCYTSLGRL